MYKKYSLNDINMFILKNKIKEKDNFNNKLINY